MDLSLVGSWPLSCTIDVGSELDSAPPDAVTRPPSVDPPDLGPVADSACLPRRSGDVALSSASMAPVKPSMLTASSASSQSMSFTSSNSPVAAVGSAGLGVVWAAGCGVGVLVDAWGLMDAGGRV
jgi:hypothetical protein